MMQEALNELVYENKEELMFFIGFMALIIYLDRDKK